MPAPADILLEQKQVLRQIMRAERLSASAANPNAFRQLADIFLAHVKLEPGACVASYSAFRGEMDAAILTEILRQRGHKIALPVIIGKGKPLVFRRHEAGDPLVANAMGIREPVPAAPIIEPDLLLVPLLAFDRNYNRLGYGAGFYDRTLGDLRARKKITAIGIAYSFQEVAEVPAGPHEARLDRIATELNLF